MSRGFEKLNILFTEVFEIHSKPTCQRKQMIYQNSFSIDSGIVTGLGIIKEPLKNLICLFALVLRSILW